MPGAAAFDSGSSPDEDYFNDLSQQPAPLGNGQRQQRRGSGEETIANNDQLPKTKRIACVLCRKRKLRCDGTKPACATCVRLQHECSYDEVRRKSGPKRGYVKALEARLAQVETLLKTKDDDPQPVQQQQQQQQQPRGVKQVPHDVVDLTANTNTLDTTLDVTDIFANGMARTDTDFLHQMDVATDPMQPFTDLNAGNGLVQDEVFNWEMIGLGLDEPLPSSDVIDELTQIYFDKVHPSHPIIHRPRYLAALHLPSHLRPPICLRYAMWCNAAAVSDKYDQLSEHFYLRARKYIQQDEMKDHGQSIATVAHCQTWTLLATYEFKLMFFPRAWMSAGRACRLSSMLGLHRLDGQGLDVKQCLAPCRDWTEREERRRTFWMCFAVDRYSSIGTGWPMVIEERDIMTNLPCPEENYELSKEISTNSLKDALRPGGVRGLSSFAGIAIIACLFGRNLLHLHRPDCSDTDHDLNGEFWKRHREIDNILLNTALALPDELRFPTGLSDPNVVFLNMNLHTSTICLHQAAIFKADKNRMASHVSAESKVRCITAAAETASIMRQISHMDLSSMNPFMAFSLYVAARVFVQYLKSRPNDSLRKSSLSFLLSAMYAIKRKNPLTESFLAQLDVDLEGAGLESSQTLRTAAGNPGQSKSSVGPAGAEQDDRRPMKCPGATYGNNGAAKYCDPADEAAPTASGNTPMNYELGDIGNNGTINVTHSHQLTLPHRTPGSDPSSNSNLHDSPPYSVNSNNNLYSSASSLSHQHSPSGLAAASQYQQTAGQQQQQSTARTQVETERNMALGAIFSSNASAYTNFNPIDDFNSTSSGTDNGAQQQQQQQHQQQQGISSASSSNMWNFQSSGGTGLTPGHTGFTPRGTGFTPGPTGFTPGATGLTPGASGMHDLLPDADWSQMLDAEGFAGQWEGMGVGVEESLMN